MQPSEAWDLTLQEWWTLFEWKTKKENKPGVGKAMTKERFDEMKRMYPDE